jgi:hypothetical protein
MTTDTSLDGFESIREAGDDVTLRRQIAQRLRGNPMTTRELADDFPERSLNAVRPRVNELLRMGCVERDGKRENPSGHEAYVHHLTGLGERYAVGDVDPEPDPPLADARRNVVEAARDYCEGAIDQHILEAVVERHDALAARLDPEGGP